MNRLELVLAVPVILIMGLSFWARRRPEVRWLQAFNLRRGLTDEQRTRLRKTQNQAIGAQLLLFGIIVPLGYGALKVMLFTEVRPAELVVVGGLSLLCIVAGIAALARNR